MAPLGNLVRILPLHINELPHHPSFESLVDSAGGNSSRSNERPAVISFVKEVLDQAIAFTDDLPNTFKDGGLKSSPPAEARVRLLSREIGTADIQSIRWTQSTIPRSYSSKNKKPAEAWFARKSQHVNRSEKGTASVEEFDFALRQDHSKHEREYTPDVFDSYKVLDWDDQIKAAVDSGWGIDDYQNISMGIFEMCHQLPAILSNRVFPVLVVTARRGDNASIVVQIPVEISNLRAVGSDLQLFVAA